MANKYAKESAEAQALRRKERTCDNKRAFDTYQEAFQKNQKIYQCPYCNKWHRSGSFMKLVRTLQHRGKK